MRISAYIKELSLALMIYSLFLFVSTYAVKDHVVDGIMRDTIVLVPMVPALFVCRAVIRELRRIDELQRKIQLEALSINFMVTAVLSISYGFLESRAHFPSISMFSVWPTIAAA